MNSSSRMTALGLGSISGASSGCQAGVRELSDTHLVTQKIGDQVVWRKIRYVSPGLSSLRGLNVVYDRLRTPFTVLTGLGGRRTGNDAAFHGDWNSHGAFHMRFISHRPGRAQASCANKLIVRPGGNWLAASRS